MTVDKDTAIGWWINFGLVCLSVAAVFCVCAVVPVFVQASRIGELNTETARLAAQLADVKASNDSLDAALRRKQRELDAANAQLPCAICRPRPKPEAKRPVPVFERGGRRTD